MKEADNAINGQCVEVLLNQETVTLLAAQHAEAAKYGGMLLRYQVRGTLSRKTTVSEHATLVRGLTC